MSPNAVQLMPMETAHRIMAVNLNASKSMETDIKVSLNLTDMHKNKVDQPDEYTLWARKGILEVNPPVASEGLLEITTDSLTWKQLVLYKLSPVTAVADGRVVISGGTPDIFYAFMNLFN